MGKVFELIGEKIVSFLNYFYALFLLFYSTLKTFFLAPLRGKRVVRKIIFSQIIFTGVDALGIISLIALSLGVIVIVQSVTQLSKVGAVSMIGKILVLTFVREISSLLTALLVISRSGSAMATEIGTMRISNQIDVLEVMGINPLHFIVLPRLIGSVIAMFCLTFYFNLVSILGGFLAAMVILNASLFRLTDVFFSALTFQDILISLSKSLIFGIIVCLISCHHGFSVRLSPTEIPQQTTRAIVNSIVFSILADGMITILIYV